MFRDFSTACFVYIHCQQWGELTHRNKGAPWPRWRSVSADGRSVAACREGPEPLDSPNAGSPSAQTVPNASVSACGIQQESFKNWTNLHSSSLSVLVLNQLVFGTLYQRHFSIIDILLEFLYIILIVFFPCHYSSLFFNMSIDFLYFSYLVTSSENHVTKWKWEILPWQLAIFLFELFLLIRVYCISSN